MRLKWMAVALVAGAVVVVSLPAGRALSQQLQRVVVENFPALQRIEGQVQVDAPIPHALTVRHLGMVVPQVRRDETTQLFAAGTVTTHGFTSVVVSLQGEVRGPFFAAGRVGVLLVPDEGPLVDVFEQRGRTDLAPEVTAPVDPGDSTFFSAQGVVLVAFPQYRIYLYNTSGKNVDVNLYLYLTH